MSIENLREEKAKKAKEIQNFHDERSEKWDDDCERQWKEMNTDYDQLGERLDRAERAAELAARDNAKPVEAPKPEANHDEKRDREVATKAWAAARKRSLSEEELAACKRTGIDPVNPEMNFRLMSDGELRAQSVGTGSEGGFTSAQGFVPELEKALLHFGGVREVARVIRTAEGNQLDWPTYNDTSNSGSLLAENTQDGETDVVFANVNLDAYKYTSDIVRVSLELMQDSAFNLEDELGRILGERLGRAGNAAYTTGTGSSQPNGCVTASGLGKTAASATAVTADEVIDLLYSVDPTYRMNATFMAEDATFQAIRKLKDGESRYLWGDGSLNGQPGMTLLGRPAVVNQDMASMTTGNKTILCGDFSKFIIRDVRDVTVIRMGERYADYLQCGFVAFLRTDSDLVDGGGGAIKHLIQA